MKKIRLLSLIVALCVIVSSFNVVVFSAEEEEASTDLMYYFNDFSKPENVENLKLSNCVEPIISTSDDGLSVLRLENTVATNSNASGFFYLAGGSKTSFIEIKDAPVLVFEYKVRMSASNKNADYFTTAFTNSVQSELTGCITRSTLLAKANTSNVIANLDRTEWNTVTTVFSNTDGSRKVYLNGELAADITTDHAFYEESGYSRSRFKQFKPHFIAYLNGLGDYLEVDYVKLYALSDSVNIESAYTYEDLDEVYVDFDSTVFDVSPEMFAIADNTVTSAKIVDIEKNIVKLTLENELDCTTEYTLTVDGVSNIGNVKCVSDINFATRDKMFRITDLELLDMGYNPALNLSFGEMFYSASFANDFDDPQTVYLYGTQYDEMGYMDKLNSFSQEVTVSKRDDFLQSEIFVSGSNSRFSAFAWKGKEIPVPVSDIVNYGTENVEKLDYEYFGVAESTAVPEITAEINDDYSGINVTVDTGEEDSRLVGLLVKYGDETEYVGNLKSVNGIANFYVPLNESNVGNYKIIAGVQKGGVVSLTPDIEFYSPSYILSEMDSKINSQEATVEDASGFVTVLGTYLGLDMEGLDLIDDKDYAYERLFSLRDAQEDGEIASIEELPALFATAVKMASIYEGKNTDKLISESSDLGIDETTKNTFRSVISGEAKKYVSDKLKGVTYQLPSDMSSDVKKHTIIGGIYRADHYSVVDTFIKIYGTELGVNVGGYYTLKAPEAIAGNILFVEYDNMESLANAINKAITTQQLAESTASPAPSGGGGGGGGGGGISPNLKYPSVKEEKKEPEKEEKPVVKSYSDVKTGDWFYEDVMWATKEGMFIGTSETTFTPHKKLTWEHITIVLSRLDFKYDNKRGKEEITRGDFADLLYNFLADKNTYKTRDEWINGTKMFIGNENGDMMFEKTLTRAECCTLLRRIESK